MKTLLMFAAVVAGAVLFFMGGAALSFAGAGGGLADTARELVMAIPGGRSIWASPWLGIAGGLALGLLGFRLSRR